MWYLARIIMWVFYNHSQSFRAGVVLHQHKRSTKNIDKIDTILRTLVWNIEWYDKEDDIKNAKQAIKQLTEV